MSVRLLLSVIFCGLYAACSVPRQHVSIPDDVAYVVVAELNETGQVTKLSALGIWTPGVTVVSRAARYRLIGYTAEQLAPFGVVITDLPPEPLQIANGCGTPLLPSPRIQLERIDGDWASVDDGADLRLTGSFVASVCTQVDPVEIENWRIDEQCSGEPLCEPIPSIIGPCAVSFDLEACGGGRLEVSIGPTGEVCIEVLGRSEICQQREEPDGFAGLSCSDGCPIDLYRNARDVEAPFLVEHINYADGVLRTPAFETRSIFVRPEILRWGHAQAMIGVEDGIVIASHHERGVQCAGTNPQFIFVDPITLDTSTAAAPACTWSLAPFEDGFFGTHEQADTWILSRFDRHGQIRASAPLVFDGSSRFWRPEQLFVSRDGTQVIAVIPNEVGDEINTNVIVAKTADLTDQRASLVSSLDTSFGATLTDDRLLIVPELSGQVILFDPVRRVSSTDPIAVLSSLRLYRPLYIGGGRTIIGSGLDAGVFVVDEQGADFGVSHPGRGAEQSVFALGPYDQDTFLAVGAEIDVDGRKAVATLFDGKQLRFRPGVWPIGQGIATDIVQRAGRTFVLLPWIGQVAVLERR